MTGRAGSLGLIVRCDMGGLGIQTHALWKHLRPEKTLVVEMPEGSGRGKQRPEIYAGDYNAHIEHHVTTHLPPNIITNFCNDLDVLLTVEGMYGDPNWEAAKRFGTTVCLEANPELYDKSRYHADRIAVPTDWALERMPQGTTVLPHPIDLPARWQQRTSIKKIGHFAAPAMLDRNGTEIFMQSLTLIKEPVKVLVHSPGVPSPEGSTRFQLGMCDVTWQHSYLSDPWDFMGSIDMLVIPRRYGGLCLPAQEAAARGILLCMTDLSPQTGWPCLRTTVTPDIVYPMKGGEYNVWKPDARSIAHAITNAVRTCDAGYQSGVSRKWAESLSWDALLPAWERWTSK